MHLAPWKLRRAELYEQFGERESAIRAYERFMEMWRAADPELQPVVAQAERRLADLQER